MNSMSGYKVRNEHKVRIIVFIEIAKCLSYANFDYNSKIKYADRPPTPFPHQPKQ